VVGETGLEPATSRSQSARSSQLSYSPMILRFAKKAIRHKDTKFSPFFKGFFWYSRMDFLKKVFMRNEEAFLEAFSKLNPAQKDAVMAIDGPVLVLAGAGTGKTQVLAIRIAQILKETDSRPENILCLTFTESGVSAMRKRLFAMIGPDAYSVNIFTFHGFCDRIIREYSERFFFLRESEQIEPLERLEMFVEIFGTLSANSPLRPYGNPDAFLRSAQSVISQLKREDISPERFQTLVFETEEFFEKSREYFELFLEKNARTISDEDVSVLSNALKQILPENTFVRILHENFFSRLELYQTEKGSFKPLKDELKKFWESLGKNLPRQKELAEKVYPAYEAMLRERGLYDFDDMVLFVLREMKKDQQFLDSFREQFSYLLADEYQDTNGAQNELLEMLSGSFDEPNIFFVGDDDQSIYRFQGASLENVIGFFKKYGKQGKIITLEENYRSTQTILDASKAVIDCNTHRIFSLLERGEKRLIAKKEKEGDSIILAEVPSLEQEREWIADQVQEYIRKGTDPSEIAVLFRNNADGDEMAEVFFEKGIPFFLDRKRDALQNTDLQKLLRLFRFLLNPEDSHELFFLLRSDFFHFDPLEVHQLFLDAKLQKKSACEMLFDRALDSKKERENDVEQESLFVHVSEQKKYLSVSSFFDSLLQWQGYFVNLPFSEAFANIANDSGFLKHILDAKKYDALTSVNALFDMVKKWMREKKDFSLADFLEKIHSHERLRVEIPIIENGRKESSVRLMTAHKAKGLEFEIVFLVKCSEKQWEKKRIFDGLSLPANVFSNDFSFEAQMRHEDERRLFYVALTRAKKRLLISFASTDQNGRESLSSRFVREIPEVLIKKNNDTRGSDPVSSPLFRMTKEKNILDVEKEMYRRALEGLMLSITHLNAYRECPRKFQYSTLLRVPQAKNKHSALGTAAHSALREIYALYSKGVLTLSAAKEKLLESFEIALKKEFLSQKDYEETLEYGKNLLEEYFFHYEKTLFSAPKTFLEYDFRSYNIEVEGVPVTGRIDKIEVLDEALKRVKVVDYKTGSPDKALAKDDATRQIVFYQLLCDLAPNFPWKMEFGELDFLKKNKKSEFVRREVGVLPEDIESLRSEIVRVWRELQTLEFLTFDESRMCGECEYCLLENGIKKKGEEHE
jgi:DNA helicase II / ATP-dependent DNA helicase PcrA